MNLKIATIGLWICLLCFTWLIHHLAEENKLEIVYTIGIGLVVTFALQSWYDKKILQSKLQKLTEVANK